MGTSWSRVLNDLMSLPTSCPEQTAVLGERWRRTNVQPKWGSGCLGSVSVPIQPSLWLLLLLQWHTVSCIRHRTKHLLSEKRRERCLKVCIAKNCSAVIWQGAKGPCPLGWKAQGNTRHKGSLERRNIVFHWRFWVSHSPQSDSAPSTPRSPEHLRAHSSSCPGGRALLGVQGTLRAQHGGLAKQLCQGAWGTDSDPDLLQPSAWWRLADTCLKPGLSRIYLRSLTAKCPDETGTSFCDV